MREISVNTKHRVVKLFLSGSSYDDIALKLGIAKGSVVNIITEFREGHLQVPRDMTEYVDALRKVAVDLRKADMSIAQAKSYCRLDLKLREMGASNENAERWLDICRDIASSSVSTDQFVRASLRLSQAVSESGLTYDDLLDDYAVKLAKSKELSREIEQQEQRLSEAKGSYREHKEQSARELDAITGAVAAAQETYNKQRQDLKARMDEYLAQHRVSWRKVDTVLALLDKELGRARMTKADIEHLSRRIFSAGSLSNVISEMEKEKKKLQSEVDRLAQEKQGIATKIKDLKSVSDSLQTSLPQSKQQLDELNTDLNSKRLELERLSRTASELTHNLCMSHLIISFLFDPNNIRDHEMDRFVGLMIGLRQKRLGIGPKQVTDRTGKVVCECQVPRMYGTVAMVESDIDKARENFAYLLAPLVKDKFISKFDYQMREVQHGIEIADAILTERRQHLI